MAEEDSVGEESDSSPVVVLLFLFVSLGLGIIIEQFMSRTKSLSSLPFTVVLFCLGLMMATISKSNFGDEFNASLNDWIHIDADLMLFIFLPPLVFGEAMSLQWHHIKTALPQCLWLAGPGVLLGTALLGMFTKLVLPYDWPWLLCLLYASILSATDTVAVLSIMNNAGASPKLSIIIVGESLFNDGTSLVLLTLLLDFIKFGSLSGGTIVSFLFSMTLGSFSLGCVIGYLTVLWLKRVNRPLKEVDVASQVTITLTVAYLTFYLAQEIFRISGVLAIVGAALVLSWQAPPIILNRETMHTVWSFIEWIGNTIIFLLAGLIIGHKVLDGVETIDWVYVVVLYIMCSLTRCLVCMGLYPVLSSCGHKASKKEVAFMAFAGLRGALGMAMGLLVIDYSDYVGIDETEANRLFFYVGGVVTLSLLINGTLASTVLELLDLGTKDSIGSMLIMDQIKRKMRKKINKMVDRMESDMDISPSDMMEIRMSCSILRPSQLDLDTLVGVMNDDEARLTGNMGHSSMSLTQRLAEAHARAVVSGNMESNISRPGSNQSSGRILKEGDQNDDDNASDVSDIHEGHRDAHLDSDSDSDVSATHKSFRRNVVDEEDSWMDAGQLVNAARSGHGGLSSGGMQPGLTSRAGLQKDNRGRGGSEGRVGVRGRGVSDHVTDQENKDRRERAMSPGVGRGRSTTNAADDRVRFRARARSKSPGPPGRSTSDNAEPLQRTFSVGDWIGLARGDRHSRYSGAGNREKVPVMSEDRARRYSKMTMLMDPSKRQTNQVNPEMLAHVRTVFLEIVRVKYWSLIEGGKLPRHCRSAQFLLYSVDVGIDEAQHNPTSLLEMNELADSENTLGDWHVIEEDINVIPVLFKALNWMDEYLPSWCGGDIAGNVLERREKEMEKRAVYMLTAFVEAHEHAQKKIHSFVGIDPHADGEFGAGGAALDMATAYNQSLINSEEKDSPKGMRGRVNTAGSEGSEAAGMQTPEEMRVKEESVSLVAKARVQLAMIESDTILEIRAKQAAMTVLAREAELVKTMTEEGLLSDSQAEVLLEEITEDRHLLEQNQDNIFRRRVHSNASFAPLDLLRGFGSDHRHVEDDEEEELSVGASNSVNVPLMDDRSDRISDRRTNDLM
jgi:sodium/hydrogen exchanger 10/11